MCTARVDGEYPLASSQRSRAVIGGLEHPAKRYTKLGFGGTQIESNQRLM